MSDQDVVHALESLERMMQAGDLDADTLASWRERFDAAMASAERGPGWAAIADRAHIMGKRLDLAIVELSIRRDAIKEELNLQAVGGRALKGYKPF